MYKLKVTKHFNLHADRANLIYRASDEYSTGIVINLPGGQQLLIGILPDYMKKPEVYVRLTEGEDGEKTGNR